MKQADSFTSPTRRAMLRAGLGAAALAVQPLVARAAPPGFDQWRDGFRARALAKGISEATWNRAMARVEPDMSVFKEIRNQPEFNEQTWQYINRRVSDWRIINGKEALKKNEALFARIEKDFGVERGTLLALWGVESAFGDPLVQQNHMRPVFPSLAALAWNEPRRKAYWETELTNALRIVDKGWSTPDEMNGSWAGAMGHTQWMPEVWLNVGIDYDRDGKISPFGKPDDALGSTAKYLVNRGKYHRGEHWGYEVRAPGGAANGSRTYAAWTSAGVTRADGQAFPQPNATRADVGTRAGRADVPARSELLFGEELQSVDELCARDLPSRRPHPGRAALHPALPRLRARADAGRSAGNANASHQGRLRHRRQRRPRRQRHDEGDPRFSGEGGAHAGGRLWRAESAGEAEAGVVAERRLSARRHSGALAKRANPESRGCRARFRVHAPRAPE